VVLGYRDTSGTGFTGTANYTYDSIEMSGTSGGVRLATASGTVVDTMSYGTQSTNPYTAGSPAPYGGDTSPPHSTARKTDGADTGNNAADFAQTSTPTPGAANRITP